ncbi:hypothetical protein NKH49_23435 [Mesorhizobium sp. M1088]|uniref:hypothetical protein n=1 Tax=Mesorhizobium sp. M1088 TaxID=2957056 RepID=UPI00333878E6
MRFEALGQPGAPWIVRRSPEMSNANACPMVSSILSEPVPARQSAEEQLSYCIGRVAGSKFCPRNRILRTTSVHDGAQASNQTRATTARRLKIVGEGRHIPRKRIFRHIHAVFADNADACLVER